MSIVPIHCKRVTVPSLFYKWAQCLTLCSTEGQHQNHLPAPYASRGQFQTRKLKLSQDREREAASEQTPPSALHSYSSVSKSTMTQLITFRKIIKTYPKCILLWKEQQTTSKTDKSRSCSSNILFSIRDKREKKCLCLENRAVWIGNDLCVFWLYECIALINYLNCRKEKNTHKASNKPKTTKTIIKSI